MKKTLCVLFGVLFVLSCYTTAYAKDTSGCCCELTDPVALIKTAQGDLIATIPYDQQPQTVTLDASAIEGKELMVEFTYQYQFNPICSMLGPHASADSFSAAEDVRAYYSIQGAPKQPISAFSLTPDDTHLELMLQLGFDDAFEDPNFFAHQYVFDVTIEYQQPAPTATPIPTPTPEPTAPPAATPSSSLTLTPSAAPEPAQPSGRAEAADSGIPKTADPACLPILLSGGALGLFGIGFSLRKRSR